MDETINQVAAIFADVAEMPMERLDRSTRFRDQDDVDSLDLANFFSDVEDELGVDLPDRKCAEFDTLGDVADYIDAQRDA